MTKGYGMTEESRVESGPDGPLTTEEQTRLDQILAEIDAGMGAWRRVGELLWELRTSRLYRETHDKFEDFCRARWGWTSRSQITRHIAAWTAAVDYEARLENVAQRATSTPQITSEHAARPLSKVPSQLRDDVVRELMVRAEDGRITERVAREAVEAALPKPRMVEETVVCPKCEGQGKVKVQRKAKR